MSTTNADTFVCRQDAPSWSHRQTAMTYHHFFIGVFCRQWWKQKLHLTKLNYTRNM